jgi:VWFA-related protein
VLSENKIGRRRLLRALALAPAARWLGGQMRPPAEQTPTYSTQVKLVNVLAGVREKSGKIVKNLTQADFRLEDEGRPQTIKFFERESGAALTLGLLVDTSGSQAGVLEKQRAAGLTFFERILRPEQDQAFVLHFDFDVELLQDFTSSRQKLQSALSLLHTAEQRVPPQRQQQQQPPGGPGGRGGAGGGRWPGGGMSSGGGGRGTCLYDAVMLASEDLMSKKDDRKALVILTDGVDNGSKVTLRRAIDAAQKADTMVYSVLYADPSNYGPPGGPGMGRGGGGRGPTSGPQGGPPERPDGKKVLQQMAAETGGRFYQVGFLHLPVEKVFADIEDDLRNRYSIGYTPEPTPDPGAFHAIKLTAQTAKKKNLVVTARTGYYGR